LAGAIERVGSAVWGEIACTDSLGPERPCVVIAQDSQTNLVGTLLIEMDGDRIAAMDDCFLPEPRSCRRTGEYPT
jgi:hypothetical protein